MVSTRTDTKDGVLWTDSLDSSIPFTFGDLDKKVGSMAVRAARLLRIGVCRSLSSGHTCRFVSSLSTFEVVRRFTSRTSHTSLHQCNCAFALMHKDVANASSHPSFCVCARPVGPSSKVHAYIAACVTTRRVCDRSCGPTCVGWGVCCCCCGWVGCW
jgi:hypothetical protein